MNVASEGSLPPEQANEMRIRALHKFYATSTLEELVLAQAHHVDKLQASLRSGEVILNSGFPNRVREG